MTQAKIMSKHCEDAPFVDDMLNQILKNLAARGSTSKEIH